MKDRWSRLCCAAILMLALPLAAFGAEERRYVVGVENIDYLPFHAGHRGRFEGFARALLDAFAASQGIAFDYKPLPVPRLLASLIGGQLDFKYPDDPHWQEPQRVGQAIRYSRPVCAYLDGTLVPLFELGEPIDRIRALGTVVGFTPSAWLDRLKEGRVVLRENADFSALILQTVTGRVDAAYANVAVVANQSQRLLGRSDALTFDRSLPKARGDYRLSTLKHTELLARFDDWLLAEAATVEALKRRHGVSVDLDDSPR